MGVVLRARCAAPVPLRWRVSNPPDVSLMCRVAFRSCGFTHGVVIGYLLSVCAHLPSHQRNSHEIRARSNNLRNRDLVLRFLCCYEVLEFLVGGRGGKPRNTKRRHGSDVFRSFGWLRSLRRCVLFSVYPAWLRRLREHWSKLYLFGVVLTSSTGIY